MRSKSIFEVFTVLLSISILGSFSFAQKDEPKKEEIITCPVSGEKVLKSEAAGPYKHNNTEYYFCCNNCMEKFKKDADTYLNKTTDPVCGMSVDKRTAMKASYEGTDYYFCSENCKTAFEKDPKTYTMKATETSKVHVHDENDKCDGCATATKEVKDCRGSKAKSTAKPEKM